MADSFPPETKNPAKKTTVTIVVPKHKSEFTLEVPVGTNISTIATDPTIINSELLAEYLPISCGGNMSCSTCHVYLKDKDQYAKSLEATNGEVEDSEDDMLDLAFGFVEGESRLGCQVIVPEEGLTVTIPDGVNDFWS